jgi:lysozyme
LFFGCCFVAAILAYANREHILRYLGYISDKIHVKPSTAINSNQRTKEVFALFPQSSFGIDVSEYQGRIRWQEVDSAYQKKIDFVVVRATAGTNYTDKKFKRNWLAIREMNVIRGAYHYFRPDENSSAQAKNFITTVHLKPGDLPPILDIERVSSVQSLHNLRKGLKNWLDIVERHYGVKPIIYSGKKFKESFLEEEFSGYRFWIAAYTSVQSELPPQQLFWQFSESGSISGIRGPVDLNIYRGDRKALQRLTIGR